MPGFEKVKTRKTQKYKKDTNSKSGKCKKYNKFLKKLKSEIQYDEWLKLMQEKSIED